MSTEFTTCPSVSFDAVLTCPGIEFEDYYEVMFTTRHRLMRGEEGTMWLFEWEGVARFERRGNQNAALLLRVANHLKVKIIDEYGIDLPEG